MIFIFFPDKKKTKLITDQLHVYKLGLGMRLQLSEEMFDNFVCFY